MNDDYVWLVFLGIIIAGSIEDIHFKIVEMIMKRKKKR